MENVSSDILDNLKKKRASLECLTNDMQHYNDQIALHAQDYKEHLKTHFDALKKAVVQLMDDRLAALVGQIDTAERSSVEKVKACRDYVEERINKINGQYVQAEALQENGNMANVGDLEGQCDTKFSLHNLASSQQLSNISIHLPLETQVMSKLENVISSHGDVSLQPFPIINDLVPKMSSVCVKWGMTFSDGSVGASYSLEMSEVGTDGEPSKYFELYKGSQTSFNVTRLKPNQGYSFRVSRQIAESLPLWSIPKSMSTLAPTFGWKSEVPSCSLTNGGATLSTLSNTTSMYVSSSRSYLCGQSLTMSVEALPRDIDCSEDGFGISSMESDVIRPLEKGTLFLTCKGVVCVGAQKMTTRLPAIKPGSSIIFSSEILYNNKVRVTIEVEEKVVIFDWSNPSDDPNLCERLNFFARLSSPGWVVTVE